MTTLSTMLEVDGLRFIEPDYASLVNNGEPAVLICEAEPIQNGAKILIDEDENPLLLAVKTASGWRATSWLFRGPGSGELALFEAADGEIYQEMRNDVEDACRAHFAEILRQEIPPAGDDLPADRIEKVRDLIHEMWGTSISGTALD
ncbi:MAG: hypothetical protein PHU87_03115, partial [Methanocorpusculum sp.]|nr:hypothetical protein [Methanocorpusculum sp.]